MLNGVLGVVAEGVVGKCLAQGNSYDFVSRCSCILYFTDDGRS